MPLGHTAHATRGPAPRRRESRQPVRCLPACSCSGWAPREAMASATARTRRALSTWRFSIMRPSTVNTPRPSASAVSNASMTRREKFDLVLRRRPDLVRRLDLAGVDECLAVEPECLALARLHQESIRVPHVVVDAVEDDLAGISGADERRREMRNEWRTIRRGAGPQLFDQVVGAHHQRSRHAGGARSSGCRAVPSVSRSSPR